MAKFKKGDQVRLKPTGPSVRARTGTIVAVFPESPYPYLVDFGGALHPLPENELEEIKRR